jgi:hypothetical protein
MQPLARTASEPRGLGNGSAAASDQGNGDLHQLIGACAQFLPPTVNQKPYRQPFLA